ncbi:MAG: hypothetical protein R3B96_15185 [Pirellulaceae bacterium]
MRGDCVELWPSYEEFAYRIERSWGDEVEQFSSIHPTSGEVLARHDNLYVYPAKHFVMPEDRSRARSSRFGRSWPSGSNNSDPRASLEAQRDSMPARGSTSKCSRGRQLSGYRKLLPSAVGTQVRWRLRKPFTIFFQR